ncbi:MAG: helix-turn-helix transcriptional regulator [Solirubrobacteraceae bacterium]
MPPVTTPLHLRAWREHRHLSQRRLAQKAHVAHTTIGSIENGRISSPRLATALAQALDTSVNRLHEPPPAPRQRRQQPRTITPEKGSSKNATGH